MKKSAGRGQRTATRNLHAARYDCGLRDLGGGSMGKVLFAAISFLSFAGAWAQHGPSASNMALLGHEELQARSAYQPLVRENHGRWIAYISHHGGKTLNTLTGREEDNGTSLVDVTDPPKPRLRAHIPGEPGQAEQGGAQMARGGKGPE